MYIYIYYTVLYYTILYYTILYCIIFYYTILYYTMLYSIILNYIGANWCKNHKRVKYQLNKSLHNFNIYKAHFLGHPVCDLTEQKHPLRYT